MSSTLLILILVILLFGGAWGWRGGYYESAPGPFYGGIGFVILILVLLMLFYPPHFSLR